MKNYLNPFACIPGVGARPTQQNASYNRHFWPLFGLVILALSIMSAFKIPEQSFSSKVISKIQSGNERESNQGYTPPKLSGLKTNTPPPVSQLINNSCSGVDYAIVFVSSNTANGTICQTETLNFDEKISSITIDVPGYSQLYSAPTSLTQFCTACSNPCSGFPICYYSDIYINLDAIGTGTQTCILSH